MGVLRKNAGVAVNEYVMVAKAEVSEAAAVTLAPVDMRFNVDEAFQNFVQSRLLDVPFVEGDSLYVVILGSTIPLLIEQAEATYPRTQAILRAIASRDKPIGHIHGVQ